MANLAEHILNCLQHIVVRPYRQTLVTKAKNVTIPLLRSVWGAALHDLDLPTYHAVFRPSEGALNVQSESAASHGEPVPGFVMRPHRTSSKTSEDEFEIDFVLLGSTAVERAEIALRAWDVASGRGLGPDRLPFVVSERRGLGPGAEVLDTPATWRLSSLTWPNAVTHGEPCRLAFPAALRIRHQGRLVTSPTLVDIVVSARHRVEEFLSGEALVAWKERKWEIEEQSRVCATTAWCGQASCLQRYSRTQDEKLEFPGVTGELTLPSGPGDLWPLISAAAWLHIGKATTNGLGELRIAVG